MWTPRLAKVRVPGRSRGSGWAIGETGVVTARDAVAGALPGASPGTSTGASPSTSPTGIAASGTSSAGAPSGIAAPPPTAVEVVLGAAPDHAFGGEILWHDEALNLALLRIRAAETDRWRALLSDEPPPSLCLPWSDPVPDVAVMGFADDAVGPDPDSTISWTLAEPDEVLGGLRPGVLRGGRWVFEPGPDRAARTRTRHLLPGAVVLRHRPESMVLGVVTRRARGRPRGRRAPSCEVSAFPDPLRHSGFAAALRRVGAPAVVYSMDGPLLRELLQPQSVDVAGHAVRVRDVTDDGWFGTHPARPDLAPADAPHYPFLDRPERADLQAAVDAALAGTGPRMIVLRGPARAGASRLVAEVVRHHPRLRDHRLLAPRPGTSVDALPARLRRGPTIVWLDHLQYLPVTSATRSTVRAGLRENAALLYLATILPEDPRQDDEPSTAPPGLSPLQAVLSDPALTTVIDLAAAPGWILDAAGSPGAGDHWASASDSRAVLDAARDRDVPLGTLLAGGPELADHYRVLPELTRVLVDVVSEWGASGVGHVVSDDDARTLWTRCAPARLDRPAARRFARASQRDLTDQWHAAVTAATTPVPAGGTLVHTTDRGMTTTLSAHRHAAAPVSTAVWDFILKEHRSSAAARVSMGIEALRAGTPQRALRAFESVLFYRDDDTDDAARAPLIEAIARRGIALYLAGRGQPDRALAVYTDLIDSAGDHDDPDVREQLVQAMLALADLFSARHSHGQAVSALIELDERFSGDEDLVIREYVAAGLQRREDTLDAMGRHDEARDCAAEIVTRYARDGSDALAAIVATARQRGDRSTS